ncbi:decarboxylating NADP(+)-dependent phosphogluconate dehydrogenase [Candidatus Poribacteria bacterium]|nr:decarboxylating NADP(+)-dependent phosphogluconate dehydrogenase [Candidatus Poribacteria bacterium]
MPQADIGLIGLAVMGENLILNMARHGFTVACTNRTADKVDAFLAGRAKGESILGFRNIADFCASLKRPRKVMMMVKAGPAVDQLVAQLLPHLEAGDILIDGGNSLFTDSRRRTKELEAKGLLFVGTGVSGGEEGALNGPSIMPGGSHAAWEHIKPVFQAIAAKTSDGEPCCDWVGEDGSGHFVKMVHNGIEYGDMQLICEAYHLMRDGAGLSVSGMHDVFAEWNRGELDSYLVEITRDILAHREDDGTPTVEFILDAAGQKGTGKWTAIAALELGQPLTLIGEAVFARTLSSFKEERVAASRQLTGPGAAFRGDSNSLVNDLRAALYASKICSYAQGYQLLRAAAKENGWNLNYGGLALMWRGGCIIRSAFLGRIKEAFDRDPALGNLLLDPFFREALATANGGWRRALISAIELGIPMPAMTSALAYYDGYRCERLPANLLQAQRDFFGAHTYERVDRPRGEFFHTNWTGHGGTTASTTYNA